MQTVQRPRDKQLVGGRSVEVPIIVLHPIVPHDHDSDTTEDAKELDIVAVGVAPKGEAVVDANGDTEVVAGGREVD